MYLLPEQIELDELIGQQINMICVGPFDAQVKFEGGMVTQSFFKLEGEVNGARTLWFNGEWIDTSGIQGFPGKCVIAVFRASDSEPKVQLVDELALYFHTEESQYESINISMPSGALEVI